METRELDWQELTQHLSKYCQSETAKKICLALSPLPGASQAENSMENIIHAQNTIAEQTVPHLHILDSLPRIMERLKIQGTLDIKDFVVVRTFLHSSTVLKNLLKTQRNPWADIQFAKIGDFKNQIYMIDKVISPDGDINEDASPTLASLNEEKKKLTREVAFVLDRVIAKRHIENALQDRYVTTREGRLVLPIKSGNQHDIKGLIHDRSFTKQTVFMEPEEAVPINNRLRDLQLLIAEEIEKILQEMSLTLSRQLMALENARATLLECDVTFAKALLTKNLRGNKVDFSSDFNLSLKDMRHPLLSLQGVDVVPNTVALNKDLRVLLLSGPNAGGKTILLKTIGLCAQMARCGLPIPVSSPSTVPFFIHIDSVVGDLQSVDQNLSSFSSHMKRLTETLGFSGSDNLILIDEICGSTDPEEGSALARSFIEHFLEKNVFAVITSHLGPLKENWNKAAPLQHGSLEFDVKKNKPTYQLLIGIPGQSLALAVARRFGVPEFIIRRAEDFLSPDSKKKSQNLQEIEDLRSQILELKAKTQKDREIAEKDKLQYSELVKKFREQRDRWLEKAIQKAEKKIENLIEEARQNRLKDKTIQDIKSDLPTIIKAQPSSFRPQTLDEFKNTFKPGTPAFSSRLGRQVVIQSEPDNKGNVAVLADSMRVQIPWHTLSLQKEEEKKPATFQRRPHQTVSSSESEPSLDLRGKRVDEALDIVEKWLDDCITQGHERLKVIHGFGTEQLKKSLRQYLSKSHYVSKWTAGDSQSEGDGITWIYLAD